MTKGKKPLPPAEKQGREFVSKTPEAAARGEADMHALIARQEDNAQALAVQLGYDGSLTVGALEDEIRFYQRRTAEACVELGKRLLILKELTPHGQFIKRVELLGVERTMATRFMNAALRFGNVGLRNISAAITTQTKMLELLVLDDGEIAALDAGESARGITLDEVETMTVSELRAALREAKETATAKDRLIADKNAKLDALATKRGRVKTEAPDDVIAGLRSELGGFAHGIEAKLSGEVLPAVRAIQDHHAQHGGDSHEFLEGALRQVERMVNTVRLECGLGEI